MGESAEMNTDIISILTVSCLVLYAANYITGVLVYFKVIAVSRLSHSIMFGILLAALLFFLINLDFLSNKFILYSVSFVLLLLLPAGTKGGKYHAAVSTAGILIFVLTMLNYQFFMIID